MSATTKAPRDFRLDFFRGAALFLIFFILLLEYNSFWQGFVTISTVIMSLAGVFLGIMVTGMSFSAIMTGLGIVALAGIVVKNGIVLIDTYDTLRHQGMPKIDAIVIRETILFRMQFSFSDLRCPNALSEWLKDHSESGYHVVRWCDLCQVCWIFMPEIQELKSSL